MCGNLVPISFTVSSIPRPAVIPSTIDSSDDGPSVGSRVLVHQGATGVPGTGVLGHSIDDGNVGVEVVFRCPGPKLRF